ncbi:flagellar biosynthetic protein FliR [Noviherbaspirillum aerium]|uniref:flagellar biosynthetic protein FliR n=1 Tax=Noviherbaspirillum aerium TaxID=2588497 RepID=UPI00124DC983|nr:flagellar biosynthetic protein FliR [Noviherbaspirillum aerium]
MLAVTSAELNTWIASFLWPLTRILGLVAAAPVFGNLSIPIRVKLGLGIMLSLCIAPTVPSIPATDPMSLSGLLIVMQQAVIGLAMGFAMRLVLAAVEMAGEICGLTMGFGFATFFDPQTRGRSSAIAQFLALLTLMIFLASNIHLLMLSTLAESFQTMPISGAPVGTSLFRQLANWGGVIFSSGIQLALPLVAALLLINIALGILTRAAPQLNLFGIGFPVTLAVGFIVLALVLPYLTTPIDRLLHQGIEFVRQATIPTRATLR